MNAIYVVGAILLGAVVYTALILSVARFVFSDRLRTRSAYVGVLAGYALSIPLAAALRVFEASKFAPFAVLALSIAVQSAALGYIARFPDGRRIGFEKAFSYVGSVALAVVVIGIAYVATTVPVQALMGQLLIGLINGSFYALLSLGLAVIFGLLNIINFTHGALYMMGAFVAWFLLNKAGLSYWWALLVAPVVVGAFGVLIERTMLKRLYQLDHLYGLLLTFGLALILQGVFRNEYGSSGMPYAMPEGLQGGRNLGFMFLPNYRAWVIIFSAAICLATWFVIEKTKLGSYLRAATENPGLVRAFGVNVPRMVTLTYGFGVGLAALAGVMAAPIYSVNPLMGADLIIVVFAVVVIGGMGSIMGSIVTGFALGVVEGLTKVFYPEASNTVIFVVMALVLMVRPAGLFGAQK